MRRAFSVAFLLLSFGLAVAASADEVVLKDGSIIKTSKPYVVKGPNALLQLPNGSLLALPLGEIDLEKTAAMKKKKAAEPVAKVPEASKPKSLAEAAMTKGSHKAAIVLTDSDVQPGMPVTLDGEKKDEKTGDVQIGSATSKKVKGGYEISGSVLNAGSVDVVGVAVTIEVIGEENKTITTAFGKVAKDSLAPGEKSEFTAEVTTEAEAKTFRYLPKWQEKAPKVEKVGGGAPGSPGEPAMGAGAAPAAAAPKPTAAPPTPAPTPRYVPQPDIAPPAANAPVGEPSTPGGAYIPRPSDNQPK